MEEKEEKSCGSALVGGRAREGSVLSVWDFVLMLFLFSIPLVNLVSMLVWGFSAGVNPNRKNFARACLLLMLAGFAAAIVLGVLTAAVMGRLMPLLDEFRVSRLCYGPPGA